MSARKSAVSIFKRSVRGGDNAASMRDINVRPGPVVTLYELESAPGTKSSHIDAKERCSSRASRL